MEENILCDDAADQYDYGHEADHADYPAILAAPFLHIITTHKDFYIAVHNQKTHAKNDDERNFKSDTCNELIHILILIKIKEHAGNCGAHKGCNSPANQCFHS